MSQIHSLIKEHGEYIATKDINDRSIYGIGISSFLNRSLIFFSVNRKSQVELLHKPFV